MRVGIRSFGRVATITGLAAMLVMTAARADELTLKDGTKITGTIVGFEGNSFKVKTNYGSAIVQKDQVVSINIAPVASADDVKKKPEPAAEKAPAPIPAPAPAKSAKPETAIVSNPATSAAPVSSSPAAPVAAAANVPAPAIAAPTPAPVAAKVSSPAVSKPVHPPAKSADSVTAKSAVAPSPTSAPAAAPGAVVAKVSAPVSVPANVSPTPSAPPKPAAPEPIRENVNGNLYTNETYGFHMYKPPDWEVIASASALMPGAIAAMGTGDQTTYLLIGQSPAGKSLVGDEDASDRRLREIMENFRPLEQQQVTIAGVPAVERRFRGSVDQHDWSGVVVLLPRGAQLFTIFGMTQADTDLVQIQENVIARAISSLQFTK